MPVLGYSALPYYRYSHIFSSLTSADQVNIPSNISVLRKSNKRSNMKKPHKNKIGKNSTQNMIKNNTANYTPATCAEQQWIKGVHAESSKKIAAIKDNKPAPAFGDSPLSVLIHIPTDTYPCKESNYVSAIYQLEYITFISLKLEQI